jgi:hypothetical protein
LWFGSQQGQQIFLYAKIIHAIPVACPVYQMGAEAKN